jgi:arabinogalactan endo-1,4-beta-galactosidase
MENEKQGGTSAGTQEKKDTAVVLRAKSKLLLNAVLLSFGIFFFILLILFLIYLNMEQEKERVLPVVQKSEEVVKDPQSTSIKQGTLTSEEVLDVEHVGAVNEEVAQTDLPSLQEVEKPTKTKKYSFGISFGETLSFVSESNLTQIFDDLASLGVGWVRVDLSWSTVQPNNAETYSWDAFDRIVSEANKRGVLVLPILTYTPSWARSPACAYTPMCEPENPEVFAKFAQSAVERYASHGVYAWEVWNEPNMQKFWANGASASRYSALLKETYRAIHTADPEAVVISGGLASTNTGNGNITAREFLEEMYAVGARNYFDAFGFHPYTFPLSPSTVKSTNAWSQMSETEWNLRDIMVANGDGYKEIWMTEFGAPTGGPKGEASDAGVGLWSTPDHVTENYQAEMLEEAVRTQKTYGWAGPLFWYSYQDLGTNTNTIENFFGIRRFDGTEKPAYFTLTTVLETL